MDPSKSGTTGFASRRRCVVLPTKTLEMVDTLSCVNSEIDTTVGLAIALVAVGGCIAICIVETGVDVMSPVAMAVPMVVSGAGTTWWCVPHCTRLGCVMIDVGTGWVMRDSGSRVHGHSWHARSRSHGRSLERAVRVTKAAHAVHELLAAFLGVGLRLAHCAGVHHLGDRLPRTLRVGLHGAQKTLCSALIQVRDLTASPLVSYCCCSRSSDSATRTVSSLTLAPPRQVVSRSSQSTSRSSS